MKKWGATCTTARKLINVQYKEAPKNAQKTSDIACEASAHLKGSKHEEDGLSDSTFTKR